MRFGFQLQKRRIRYGAFGSIAIEISSADEIHF